MPRAWGPQADDPHCHTLAILPHSLSASPGPRDAMRGSSKVEAQYIAVALQPKQAPQILRAIRQARGVHCSDAESRAGTKHTDPANASIGGASYVTSH